MLRIVDDEHNEGTLKITEAGNKLKFKISEHNTDEEYSIKLGYKKLTKLSKRIHKFIDSVDETSDLDGTSIVIEKYQGFLEVELSYENLGFVVGTMIDGRQGDWVVITITQEELEDIVKFIDDKLITLEEVKLNV